MIEFNEREQEPGEDGGGLSVAVVGVGGAGANVLDRIALEGMTEAELVCMNTDIRALTNSVAATKVQLGKNLTQGLGAGGDPELGEDAAKSSEEEVRNALRGKDMVFVCGGLGGGTGSGAAPFISSVARSEGAFVVAFTTMPFSFEGRRRLSQAQSSLNQLRKSANALITFDNDRMGSLVLPKQGIQEAFAEADKIISQSVRAVIQLVTKPGLISIGMDDLITALDNDDSRCLFGYGQATGENRAQEALATALKSPLLDKGEMLDDAQNVLVHICGGDSMTLFEVELLMKSLEKEVSDNAQILFGVGSDPKLGDKLSVTVISSMGKPLPPTAEDDTPKAARTESGSERVDSAPAESLEPEASQSSRSEVKPDQSAGGGKTGVPVAAAATSLGASMLSAPAAEAASTIPKARMSPIRRAVQPVQSPSETPPEADESKEQIAEKSAPVPHSDRAETGGSQRKGVISIFDDDDEDSADTGSSFDDDDDLDDELDLMGDLGLDDEELDRLVAESATVGLDDGEDDEDEVDAGEKHLSLLDDDDLDTDLISDEELDRAVEEELAPSEEKEDDIEEVVQLSGEPPVEDEVAAKDDPFDIAKKTVDQEDQSDTIVAGAAAAEPLSPAVEQEKKTPVAEPEEDDFLPVGSEEDDFESFDDDDELEDDIDELEDDFDEFEEIEESEATEVAEVAGIVDDEGGTAIAEKADTDADDDFLDEDDLEEDEGDPLFDQEQDHDAAPKPLPVTEAEEKGEPGEIAPTAVAAAQATKADELLKRVGLRRASSGKSPGAPSEAPAIAAERPQAAPQAKGRTPFAWSKPGTSPQSAPAPAPTLPAAADEADESSAARTQLPPPRNRPAAAKAVPSAPKAAEQVPAQEASTESPFIPKGFLNKKPQEAAEPRRVLPVKPTPLKLGKPEPVEQEVEQHQPSGESEPEQQNFDSTLEPQQKGRFDKGEPTVENGEDLDLPTFLRRKKG